MQTGRHLNRAGPFVTSWHNAEMASMHPAMDLARRGPRGKVDKFLQLWLALLTDGRQARFEPGRRRTRRTIERFFADRHVRAAETEVGQEALAVELREAAALYFSTCLTDSNYSMTLFRTRKMDPERLLGKVAGEAASAVGVILESQPTGEMASRLPVLLVGGYLDEIGIDGAPALLAALRRVPAAEDSAEMLLEWAAGLP